MPFENLPPYALWLIAGLILCIFEMIVPGVFLMWLGIAALIVGALALIVPLNLVAQLVLFAGLALVLVFAGRRWTGTNHITSDDPMLNDRQARLVGQSVEVVEAIANGRGRVKVGDSVWPASGADAGVGETLTIISADSGVLTVGSRTGQASA